MISLVRLRIAVPDYALPSALTIAQKKKNLHSETPAELVRRLVFATRETVLSCTPISLPPPVEISGLKAIAP